MKPPQSSNLALKQSSNPKELASPLPRHHKPLQKFTLAKLPELLKSAFAAWRADKAPTHGAALAYFAVFSLAPLIVIAIAIAGAFFGQEAARGQITGQIAGLLGTDAAKAIEGIVQNASKHGSGIAGAIGVVTLLLGASGVFGQLKEALNDIWEVEPAPSQGFLHTLKSRFVSIAMIFGVCFLLVVSLLVSATISATIGMLGLEAGVLLHIADFLLSVGILTLLFAGIFKFIPDATIQWRDVWLGAFLTAILFAIGKILIGLYLGRSGTASAYGATGSIILVLLWTYYASQILFFGAEITKTYADKYGKAPVAPTGRRGLGEEADAA